MAAPKGEESPSITEPVSYTHLLLELDISEEQSERVREILYQRGIEVLGVTAREV